MQELAEICYVTTKRKVRPGAVDNELNTRTPFYEYGICAASFEPKEGELLAAVGVDEKLHELGVWEWKTGRLIGSTQTISSATPGVPAVHALAWAPRHAHAQPQGAHVFVVVGASPMPRFVFAVPQGQGQWHFANKQGQPLAAKGRGEGKVLCDGYNSCLVPPPPDSLISGAS
ncbi:hypothetical protein T492DRAFT_206247 [Pavlovales sp. CCMP2436]|nr:hypothetical protein T492DRAFT_206247 [Pavlovales sp. CCMP2436]